MRVWSCVLLLAGCDRVFKLDELPEVHAADARTDTAGPDMPPAVCGTPQVFDDFTTTTPPYCPRGDAYGPNLLQHDGVLDITLPGTDDMMSGCSFNGSYAFTGGGVILQVPQVNAVATAYTTLTVRGTDSQFAIVYKAQALHFGTLAFDYAQRGGQAAPWWRMRNNNGQLEALTSMDGSNWDSFAVVAVTPPDQVSVDIGTGLDVAPTVPGGQATFSLFAICN